MFCEDQEHANGLKSGSGSVSLEVGVKLWAKSMLMLSRMNSKLIHIATSRELQLLIMKGSQWGYSWHGFLYSKWSEKQRRENSRAKPQSFL